MPTFHRTLWRAAGRVQQALQPPARTAVPCQLYRQLVDCIAGLEDRHELALQRGWTSALQHLGLATKSQLLRLKSQVDEVMQHLHSENEYRRRPSQASIYDELIALSDEFSEFEVDLKQQTVAVVTTPIVFDDIALGRFRIVFYWNRCRRENVRTYTVQALEPNCPDSNSSVTHPHVLSDQLCEGDAALPLQHALRSGRLGDFFLIIQTVLRTYNGESPYATLDQWSGVDCQGCGDHVAGEAEYCSHCHVSVCANCSSWCEHCDGSRCDSCLGVCSDCENGCCEECLEECVACQNHVCPNCLSSNHLCKACQHETSKHDTAEESGSIPAQIAVQSMGLGEVALSA